MSAKHGPGDRLAQARRLKAVRDWTDVTRADVARAIGVDPSTITLWESGRLPGEERLADVATYLGVTPAWIRYGLENAPPPAAVADHEEGARAHVAGTKKAAHKAAPKKRRA